MEDSKDNPIYLGDPRFVPLYPDPLLIQLRKAPLISAWKGSGAS